MITKDVIFGWFMSREFNLPLQKPFGEVDLRRRPFQRYFSLLDLTSLHCYPFSFAQASIAKLCHW